MKDYVEILEIFIVLKKLFISVFCTEEVLNIIFEILCKQILLFRKFIFLISFPFVIFKKKHWSIKSFSWFKSTNKQFITHLFSREVFHHRGTFHRKFHHMKQVTPGPFAPTEIYICGFLTYYWLFPFQRTKRKIFGSPKFI